MKKSKINLQVEVGRVRLRNPVLLAAGTCGYGLELKGQVSLSALGGIVTKSLTLQPRSGNPMPRIAECASGMLNAIGLENIGVMAFCRDKLPWLRKLSCVVIANIAGATPEEYVALASLLETQPGVAGLELNVSCPNVQAGGIEFGRDPLVLARLVQRVRQRTRLPLWVKLSPNVTDIIPLAQAAAKAGADALTIMNTLIGMRLDIKKRKPVLAHGKGGLSGPAIKPVALHLVYAVAGAVAIPVIGVGGIETPEDAVEFFLAGAQAVQIGTATFRNPAAAENVVQGLRQYLQGQGWSNMKQLVGAGRSA